MGKQPAVALVVTGLWLSCAATPAAATDLFASPDGTGSGPGGAGICTQSAPQGPQLCSLTQAFAVLGPGDDLTLLGDSNYPAIGTTLQVDGNATVHGSPGTPATIPTTETASAAVWVSGGGVLRDVSIIGSPDHLATGVQIFDDGMIDRVFVDAGAKPGANACVAVNDGAVFRDSVCWTRGASGAGVSLGASFGSTNAATVRNVTAAATGDNGAGIRATATIPGSKLTVQATNTIALGEDASTGTLADVFAETNGDPGASATVVLDHSHYNSPDTLLGGAIVSGAGNVASPEPLFVNAPSGLFGEAVNSTGTIDRGTAEVVGGIGNGDLAVSGQPRCLGAAPDIGAEEFAAAACASGGGASPPPAPPSPPAGTKKCPKGKKLKKIRGKKRCVKKRKKRRR